MSNRIANAFSNGKAFIGFVTGGDPSIEASEEFILAMAESGADLIEIGIPFSDPIAEGPVIQAANIRALGAGVTVDRIFELAAAVRAKTEVPLVFLTYLNPVFKRGYDSFFKRCAEVGADGVIIPDMPFEEQGEAKRFAQAHGIALISMVAPTSEQRVAEIAKSAEGFLYVVSSMGVTGVRGEIRTDLDALIKPIRKHSAIPAAVGFGVSTPRQAAEISRIADGVIVGSAIVRIVEQYGKDAATHLRAYVSEMKSAME
ncbi:MAG: tryptophan synthase subunit alpha [Oscillospiraceae bacterium]|jgi:tryptophan synthase alpha chain|nr:tryptophan synthase subunit alpha [Oscillospiraceae bacterium]